MAESSEPALRTYRGNCHCGAFVYEAEVPEIKDAVSCNCSLCHKKGYLWVVPELKNFRVVKGDEDQTLTSYTFGSGCVFHKFCSNCATPLLARMVDGGVTTRLFVNVHSLQDFNTWDLPKNPFDGAAFGTPYQQPEHKGALPTAEVENGKLYTGGCHCGAVTMAVLSKPIDETYDERLIECDCSICERNGYFWAYPKPEQVVLAGKDSNIGRYQFSRKVLDKTFCRTCGVNLTNSAARLTAGEVEGLSDDARAWYENVKKIHAVNVRALLEVDLGRLKGARNKGSSFEPRYVNP